MTPDDGEFFIGWSNRVGSGLGRFLLLVATAAIGGLAALSAVLALSITDPARSLLGAGAAPDMPSEVTLSGVLTSEPYPLLATAADAAHPTGHGFMLVGDGKHAAGYDRTALEGRTVEIKGLLLKRGALDMVVVNDGPRLVADDGGTKPWLPVPLGRWRVVGEICDGKCGAGIMSPGTGLAHKACANLCIIGGVPPVLVLTQQLQGHQYLMIANGEGRALDDRLLNFIGMRVEIEGDVELRGDVAMMRIAPGRMRRL